MCKRNNPLGYLTISMIDRYVHCPLQFFYEYVEGYGLKRSNANLAFGSIIHEVIAEALRKNAMLDPGVLLPCPNPDLFLEKWESVGDLTYSYRTNHSSMKAIGVKLIKKMSEFPYPGGVVAVEKAYQTELPDGTILKGTVDAEFESFDEDSFLDWKTSGSKFLAFRPSLDDQLTCYSMLSRIKSCGYGILLKKKEPEIYPMMSSRTEENWENLTIKVMKIAADIEAGFFHKNPSQMQCNMCDFSALCLGNKDKAKDELKQGRIKDRYFGKSCQLAKV